MLSFFNRKSQLASCLIVLVLMFSTVYANEMVKPMPDMSPSECSVMMDCGICAVPVEITSSLQYSLAPSLDFVSVFSQQTPFSIHDRLYHPPR